MSKSRPPWSLRRRLLALLMNATLGIWILSAVTLYFDADRESRKLFDETLAETAHLIVTLAQHELEESSHGTSFVESAESSHAHFLFFQIWDAAGRLRYRTRGTPEQPFVPGAATGFGWASLNGETWRTYSVWNGDRRLQIQIAQPLTHRREISSGIAWRLSLFALIFLPLLMSLIWLLTNRAFAPVHRSAQEVAGRSGSDLREIDERGAPQEVLPLLSALNRLFAHARAEIDRERRFTADAAHELRTPLAAIRTHLQVLESARSDQEAAEAVRDLHAGIDRSSALIDQLLALAKVDAQSSPQAFERVALDHLVAAGVAAQAPAAAKKNITLAAHTVPASVAANREMLALLLRNLIDNAIKYTPAGGEVRVSCAADQGRAKLTVIDNGIGIAPAQRARVFDRFFRAAASDATGSGLGLSIVQRVAEQHRARVMLADGLEGRGLCVSVEFPIAAMTDAESPPMAPIRPL